MLSKFIVWTIVFAQSDMYILYIYFYVFRTVNIYLNFDSYIYHLVVTWGNKIYETVKHGIPIK